MKLILEPGIRIEPTISRRDTLVHGIKIIVHTVSQHDQIVTGRTFGGLKVQVSEIRFTIGFEVRSEAPTWVSGIGTALRSGDLVDRVRSGRIEECFGVSDRTSDHHPLGGVEHGGHEDAEEGGGARFGKLLFNAIQDVIMRG